MSPVLFSLMFLILLKEYSSAVKVPGCDQRKPLVVHEQRKDFVVKCENIGRTNNVVWYFQASNKYDSLGICYAILPLCARFSAYIKISRPAPDVSVLHITDLRAMKRAGLTAIRCGESTNWGQYGNSYTCGIDIIQT